MWRHTIDNYNLSYSQLFKAETKPGLSGWEKGTVTQFGAVSVDTGRFTGRSPEDKFIVAGGPASRHVWWRDQANPQSPNQPLAIEAWDYLYDLAQHQLKGNQVYVQDGFLGARKSLQLKVRLITEVAWQAHFFKNMFIRSNGSELSESSEPSWTIYSASKTTAKDWEKFGLNSEAAVAINLEKRQVVIVGTWYGGEIKKGLFSIANYALPLQKVGSFHCSANIGKDGKSALFFGLSGTGKTTLSHDPKRQLIGDDEHGWDDQGVFNLEGGCYAKVINLSQDGEPEIYQAIKRNALLENVVVNRKGKVDFTASAKTENTRVSYPIEHVGIRVKGDLVGPHPKTVVFLTCDSFGVLPPVAKLTQAQARYWFLSGYTAKIAGTERGINEPKAAFSSCFGLPFLTLHPQVYARILAEKIKQYQSQVYLINTGWSGGGYGVGQRISLAATRQIVTQVLTGKLARVDYQLTQPFGLRIPKKVAGVDSQILNPKNTWTDKAAFANQARRLHRLFQENFKRFEK
ncbi:MAG: phosphoenolpyruvate carboxykinase (ATP) [Patescibacteria group bacterium]|nr:phosphoenolpyruvate carboxykinase (ATP) [Patescibacteria group bacterium]